MPSPTHERGRAPSSSEVGRSFRAGDPTAVQRVREYTRRVLSFRQFGIPAADVDDLEQQAMSDIWRAVARPGFDSQAGFWGFVERVTIRRCIDYRRRRRSQVPLDPSLADDSSDPHDDAVVSDRLGRAEAAIAAVGEPCRTLLRLRFIEDQSFNEISRALGKSAGALRVQLLRCVRRVQRQLRRDGRMEHLRE